MNPKLPAAEPRIVPIPLGSLFLSPSNVRRTDAGKSAFAELKASIAAHGLLENMIVCPSPDSGPGRYSVIAGGRRFAALSELASDGLLTDDSPIPCLVLDAGAPASEISLAENVIRVAMHPADQVQAFAVLADTGSTVSEIAARFGVSERAVEQRLRLGNAAPELVDAYRADDMDLQSLQAFAVTTDHARQTAVWNQVGNQGYRPSAWQIKRLLTEDRIPCNAAVAMFVGVDAYEAAGGAVDRDLFASEEEGGIWFNDPVLLDKLATDRLAAAAAEHGKTWKWAEARIETPWNDLAAFGRVHALPADPTAEERDELAGLKTRQEELAEKDDDEWTEEFVIEAETIEERIDRIQAGIDARATFAPEDMAIAGCIATVGRDGSLQIVAGLVRPEDIPAPAAPASGDSTGHAPSATTPTGPSTVRTSAITAPAVTGDPAAEARKRAGVGIGLGDDLRAVRTTAVKVGLAEDFEAAFDLTVFQMARAVFTRGYVDHALDIAIRETPDRPSLRMNDADFGAANPAEAVLHDVSALPLDWMQIDDRNESFAALCALPAADKQRLFSACVARTLKGQLAFEHDAKPEFEATVARLDIDFAKHVRPTAEMYWSRIRKPDMLAVARETLGVEWAASHSRDKKPVIADAMEKAFAAGDEPAIGLTAETHAVAAAWTFPGFRAFDTIPAGADPDPDRPEPPVPASPAGTRTDPASESSIDETTESPPVSETAAAAHDTGDHATTSPDDLQTAHPSNDDAPPPEPAGPRVIIGTAPLQDDTDDTHESAVDSAPMPPPGPANGHDANGEAFDIPEFLRRG